MIFPYLSAIIFIPLVGAVAVAFLPQENRGIIRWVTAGFSFAALTVSLAVFAQFNLSSSSPQFVEKVPWIARFNIQYFVGVDGLSLPLVILTTLLTFLAVVGSWHIDNRAKEYNILLLVLETGILGVFTSLDLLLFFLFWEVELVPMYLLIGIWGGPRREYAAIKFVLYTLAGSAFMLVGILALYFTSNPRTFDMTQLAAASWALNFQMIVFALIFLAFAIKLPMFPFHTWLPDAHVEAPTAVSVLLAGVLLKMGGYGMIRVCFNILPDAAREYAPWLAAIAVINILYGAGLSMVQKDLKKLVAYSSISHMGYVLLGLAALNQVAVNGAVLQMFTHGAITGLLFFLVGAVYEKTHTREIAKMSGLAPRMPTLAALWVMAGLAALGLPGMAGFVAEYTVFVGAFGPWAWYTILGAAGIVVTAGYILWMIERVFFGPANPAQGLAHVGDAKRWYELVPLVTLMGVVLFVGINPSVVVNIINSGVLPVVARLGA
ncbi:MAG: NADH-quinone oxidoreductase subunit M [Chloroflexi bacterium]|nr:NADH-quinone oxidoreductase subunit M [Chloroflexota bacterium]MCL5110112.1 NADH-quinone oxidoreductase subunit M [Chloroflexota bacterium]MDA8219740.1 NADH-quinone oxidoreductase subunit M [Dehalococcoidales bacterium]